MRINPGGRLNTEDIIGRDNEIARYWRVLERQGLVISAERRIGKTHIVLKMREECRSEFLPFYQDLEAVHSVADLVRSIYQLVEHSSKASPGVRTRIAKWSGLFPKKIAGVDFPTISNTWQVLLNEAFNDLFRVAGDRVVLMLWDEFPLMLHNLQRKEGHDSAIKLLDFLRALRHDSSDRLRFLFTGSIGLHLVLRSLRAEGNANDPVNDMLSLTVPPMTREDTCNLASALLEKTAPHLRIFLNWPRGLPARLAVFPTMSTISLTRFINCGANLIFRTSPRPWTVSSMTRTTRRTSTTT